jgi:hypothetical protein
LEVQEFMFNVAPNNNVLLENWKTLVTKHSKKVFHFW